ncbi:MAG: hypothetical protein AAF944_07305 [Bacteroidota bacterium]
MIWKAILFTALLLVNLHLFGQKTVDITLGKDEVIMDFVDLQEQGFVIKTGKEKYYSKNVDWHLRYYTPTLEEVWSLPIEPSQGNKGRGQDVVVAPSGNYVYHVENQGFISDILVGGIQLTQVNRQGQVRSHEVGKDILGKIAGIEEIRLCDESHFYIVSLKQGNNNTPTQLFLNRFLHQDFSFSQLTVELPIIARKNSVAPWEYAGHGKQHIWFVSKTIPNEKDAIQCQLVAVDWQGKIARKLTVNQAMPSVYLRGSMNHKHSIGAVARRTATTSYTDQNHMSGMPHTTFKLGTSGWTSVYMDDNSDIVYVYGLYGKKQRKGSAAYADGFYLMAFNEKGELLWQHLSNERDPILEDKYFQKRLTSDQRATMAYLTTEGVRFQIRVPRALYTYDFSQNGQRIDMYQNSYYNPENRTFFLSLPADSSARTYYQTNASKKKTYFGTNTSLSNVLIEHDGKRALRLLQW